MAQSKAPCKTIVFCCNSLWGLVNFRGRVIEALVADGHRVVLVAHEDVPAQQASALGAEFRQWDVAPRGTNILRELRAVKDLIRIYREVAPDIGFQFTVKPVIYGAVVSWFTKVPCVSVITGLGYLFLGGRLKTWAAKTLYRRTLHRSREVWFLNDDDRQMFESAGVLNGLHVRTLPGEGVDIGRFAVSPLPSLDQGFRFLMVARLVKDKGVLEYAQAAAKVRASRPDVHFQLLGPPYLANDMSVPMDAVECWKRDGVVDYLGAADDVRDAVRNAHCIVLPSYREGMPRVLMEAAAMGRPAVTTNVTGCRDVVLSGETGLLCEPRDASSLASACEKILSLGAAALQRMGTRSREHAVARFDDLIVIALYKQVLQALDANR